MARPQEGVFWLGLGALLALLINTAALLLPLGLSGSSFQAFGLTFSLGWLFVAWLTSASARSCWTLASMLLLGVQLLGYAFGALPIVALAAGFGLPVLALAAAHPVMRLPGLGMGLPLGSTLALALGFLLALADLLSPADPVIHWGWVYAWGLAVVCVALWHAWGSGLPAPSMIRAEAVLLGWIGAVIVIPLRLTLVPALPPEHFRALAGVVDATAIALLFASAWAARQVATSLHRYERTPR